jgi:hypothetical protein
MVIVLPACNTGSKSLSITEGLEKIGIVLAESHQPVVVSYLRKYGKVYDREIVTTQSPSILSEHEIR